MLPSVRIHTLLLSFIILIADILVGANLFRHDFFLSLKLLSLFIFYATNPWGCWEVMMLQGGHTVHA